MNPMTASLVLAASLFTVASAGATDTLSVIHKFLGGNDGNDPNSLIQASDGNFYGTTYLYVGTVFKVTPDGQFTTLFILPPQNPNRYFYGDFFTSVVEGPDVPVATRTPTTARAWRAIRFISSYWIGTRSRAAIWLPSRRCRVSKMGWASRSCIG